MKKKKLNKDKKKKNKIFFNIQIIELYITFFLRETKINLIFFKKEINVI